MFVKVCLNGPSPLSCALLYLVSELIFKRPQLLALKTHRQQIYEEDDNDDEEHYKDAPLEVSMANNQSSKCCVCLNNIIFMLHLQHLLNVYPYFQYCSSMRSASFFFMFLIVKSMYRTYSIKSCCYKNLKIK